MLNTNEIPPIYTSTIEILDMYSGSYFDLEMQDAPPSYKESMGRTAPKTFKNIKKNRLLKRIGKITLSEIIFWIFMIFGIGILGVIIAVIFVSMPTN